MNKKLVFFWALTSALAGFLFGFDTVVISGAEQRIQELWGLNSAMHGLAMSMALWGTVLGALVGGYPSQKWGRKPTLLWIGILYFVSAIGSAFAPDPYTFMIARFIGGVGIGISTIASPMFIAEISPAKSRGWLTGLFQFNIVFGILVAFLSNWSLGGIGENAWRWMMGVEAVPALLYTIFCFTIPESPRWLISKGRSEEGKQVFAKIHPESNENELEERVTTIAQSLKDEANKTSGHWWSPALKKPMLLAFLIAFFNQLSGINAVLYFAPRIFEMTGLGNEAALLQSVGIGITNLIFTFAGLYLIDRLGRKTLLFIGSLGYITSLGLCAWAFFSETYFIVPACIFAFIASHAVGQGAVIWVFIGEIFPNRARAIGQTIGCSTHWIFAGVITLIFPSLVTLFEAYQVFLFFCSMMILQLIWVLLMMPETKGISLEEMQKKLGISK